MPFNLDYYSRDSRYLKNITIKPTSNGTKIPLLFEKITFLSKDIEYYYTVAANEAGRIDLIAYKLYGDSHFWWVLARANNVSDFTSRPVASEVLAVPSFSAIKNYI